MSTGRKWAYLGTIIGASASVAGNIGNVVVSGHTSIGSLFFAALWPVALFIALEILTKVEWPDTPGWQIVQWCGLLPIALISAVISWHHISELLTHFGEPKFSARTGPLVIDGLMLLSASALLIQPSVKRARKRAVKATEMVTASVAPKTSRKPASARAAERAAYEASILNGNRLTIDQVAELCGISKGAAESQRKRWDKTIPVSHER